MTVGEMLLDVFAQMMMVGLWCFLSVY